MAAFLRQWGILPKGNEPEFFDSDDVYPMHLLDAGKSIREIACIWTLRFNDVLDPEKLHESLKTLLDMGDWRKLGGRIRQKVRICVTDLHLETIPVSSL